MAIASSSVQSPLQDLLTQLRGFSQHDLQPGWRFCRADLPPDQATQPDTWATWDPVSGSDGLINAKHQIAWDKGRQVLWLGQTLVLPANLKGYPVVGLQLRLYLTWWADVGEVYVDGTLVQTGDLFDAVTRYCLTPAVKPGQQVAIALRLVSPNHDGGALMLSQLRFEAPDWEVQGRLIPEPGFVADELAVLATYLTQLPPPPASNRQDHSGIDRNLVQPLGQLLAALQHLHTLDPTVAPRQDTPPILLAQPNALDEGLAQLRDRLARQYGDWLKQREIQLVGHAHLDMAWLWPVAETWEAAQRTFESALNLQQDLPELTFAHSSPALYEWIRQHRPDLWQRIMAAIAEGKWEVIAGFWIEPDCNLPSGESLTRQVLYGQRYTEKTMGVKNRLAWVPDTFGFCWQLPQILRQGGMDYFVTQKLTWNDTTKFPYQWFDWRSPDGTEIRAYMSALIGTHIDAVPMAEYACQWEANTGYTQSLWIPGVGDHGGGPTREMLDSAKRWSRSPLFPRLSFTTVHQYLDSLSQEIASSEFRVPSSEFPSSPPRWDQDLYLEFHRGCYTSHADQKGYNRKAEALLYEAELWATIAHLKAGLTYPKSALEMLWKLTLFNQFHDILPGSSIPEVYGDANRGWQRVLAESVLILEDALEAIARTLPLPPAPSPEAIPVLIWNPLNWERSEVVSISFAPAFVQDGQQSEINIGYFGTVQFLKITVPGMGYSVVWLDPTAMISPAPPPHSPYTLDNTHLRVTLDATTGAIAQIFDKTLGREILSGLGNQLQFFQDQGQFWDAWNIDPHYAQYSLSGLELLKIEAIATHPLEQRIRVQQRFNQSQIQQDYILQADSNLLRIETQIDWQEEHILLKAAFPLALEADVATYEVPCAAQTRPTRPNTAAEKAQWELPALRWADLTAQTGEWGVSLLNDSKYGYDHTPNQLRLTLLRSPSWPDPTCDRGLHQFSYALYSHRGDWRSAHTVRRGYEMQHPLRAMVLRPATPFNLSHLKQIPGQASPGTTQGDQQNETQSGQQDEVRFMPSCNATQGQLLQGQLLQGQFIQGQFIQAESESFVVTAFKLAEDEDQGVILRGYEAHGAGGAIADSAQRQRLTLTNSLGVHPSERVDGLEQSCPGAIDQIQPWEIIAIRLKSVPH